MSARRVIGLIRTRLQIDTWTALDENISASSEQAEVF
jgi:hypothetical protein